MRNLLSSFLLAAITITLLGMGLITIPKIISYTNRSVLGIEGRGPDFVIPGDLLYRPYLDCRGFGGLLLLEMHKELKLYHIKTVCGTGIIFNYVYTDKGEVRTENADAVKGVFEAGAGEIL